MWTGGNEILSIRNKGNPAILNNMNETKKNIISSEINPSQEDKYWISYP